MSEGMVFFVEGQPEGKARPRFTRAGITFTPKKTVAYEERIRDRFLQAGGKMVPYGGYVFINVEAIFDIPKSYPKKKREACLCGGIRPDKKPDADNILKAVLDALNGVAYEDDRQVVEVLCIKKYIGGDGWKSYGMEPGLYIGIGMLGGSEHAE